MNLPVSIAPGIELPDRDRLRLEALADTLSPDQALWASGYLAGVAHARRAAGKTCGCTVPAVAAVSPAPAFATSVAILFASETGNAEELARRIELRANGAGLVAGVRDLSTFKPRDVNEWREAQLTLIVTSTHGEGEPPGPAAGFFELLLGRKAPKLGGVRFAVLGLGDSTYEYFCEAAKVLDRRFEELGATRVHERLDCDVDYEERAEAWIAGVLEELHSADLPSPAVAATAADRQVAARLEATAHDKRRPFAATVLENITITGRGSSKEIRHVEFAIDGSSLTYRPGDSLGVVPHNDPALVRELIETCGFSGSETVLLAGAGITIDEALSREYEITALTPRFLQHWSELAGADGLRALVAQADRSELASFLRGHHVIDVIRAHPVPGLDPSLLTAGLRALQPRLYSIASSQLAAPGEVHITVSAVRYELHGTERRGIASCHLAERVRPDDTIPVYVQRNDNFRLPADPGVPIVMIGAGTGVAPFRAFAQERDARGSGGKSWLFFGERNFRTDFLYQAEWLDWLKSGVLTRMHVAFSRDQAAKRYVQHVIEEQGSDLFGWLEEGAHVYVCGDAQKLAPDVHAALVGVVEKQGAVARERAEEYLRDLQREGRYQRDVY